MLEIDFHPSLRKLRQFGVISTICFTALSATFLLKHATISWGSVCGFMVLYSLCGTFVAPRILRPLFVGLSLMAYPVGWLVSHLILLVVFFCVFFPVGIVLRLLGKDPLVRDRKVTNWEKNGKKRDLKDYLQQY